MRSPVSRGALGECNAIRSWGFGPSELTSGSALETEVDVSHKRVSEAPTIRELTLLWFALPRLAHREQENDTLVFCVR
jgi:hypothetical protein